MNLSFASLYLPVLLTCWDQEGMLSITENVEEQIELAFILDGR